MDVKNIAIIGSGPSGWSAGIYTSRANLQPLIFAGEKSGGQLMFTTEVENFPGFDAGILGPDLMSQMRQQSVKFGAKVLDANVTRVDFSTRPFQIFSGEDVYLTHSVIVATGAESIMLGVPDEKRLLGRGVATCAVCDAPFYKNKKTFVVGGGDAAVEDTLALVKFAESVTMIVRSDKLRASKIMQDRVLTHPKVSILWNTQLIRVSGERFLEKITTINTVTKQTHEHMANGLFLAIGHRPTTDLFAGQLDLDEKGYLLTRLGLSKKSLSMASSHLDEHGLVSYLTMTSIEGVFGAGDVVDFRYKQAITAAAMGTMAALDAEKWLENQNT